MPKNELPNVSRETIQKLEQFIVLVRKWTKSINLIAPSTSDNIWNRHILDSAQILKLAPKGWKNWIDIGSGGGFPGLVIAIMDENQRPMTLIESDQRKCLFLNTVRRELDLNVTICHERIETAEVKPSDILSARALAPLTELLTFSQTLLSPSGTALFPKGASYKEELDRASMDWHFDVMTHPSLTSPDSRILELSGIQKREP